mgnify:CR=1 FL=1
MRYQSIAFTARETAQLIEAEYDQELGADEVFGQTLYTLVSPGTELAGAYLGERFPSHPGYAAAFRVEALGADVSGIAEGEIGRAHV